MPPERADESSAYAFFVRDRLAYTQSEQVFGNNDVTTAIDQSLGAIFELESSSAGCRLSSMGICVGDRVTQDANVHHKD